MGRVLCFFGVVVGVGEKEFWKGVCGGLGECGRVGLGRVSGVGALFDNAH